MNLIAVNPSEDSFSITWAISPRCNYECSYCPPRLHDKTSAYKDLEELQTIWRRIVNNTSHRNKRYKISFTGGEVTVNPDFVPFLKWLQEEYHDLISNVGFTTNGSANLKVYLRAIEFVNYITFSSHFEYANESKLRSNILSTHRRSKILGKNVFVNIMEEDQIESVQSLKSFCEENNIPHSLMRIHWGDHAEARRKAQL